MGLLSNYFRKGRTGLLVGILAVGSVAAVAVADTLRADGDGIAPVGDNNMAAGSISCGQETNKTALLAIRRNGDAGGPNVFKDGSTVTLSVVGVTGTNASAVTASIPSSDNTIALPSDWGSKSNNTMSTQTVSSAVKIHPTASGAGSATIRYRATGIEAKDSTTYTQEDTMDVTWTAGTCVVNAAPSVPGAPALASGSSSPNRGVFGLAWTASTDDGLPSGSSISYQLQHKDADDSAYSDVTGATALSTNSFAFSSASSETEGTWTYQVRASDGTLQSAYSGESSAVKVDKSAPSTPTAGFSKTAEDTVGGWYKDSVVVSYSGSTDPSLIDGSAGSGIASHGTSQTFNTTGTHSYSGSATDNAGNVSSSAASGSVKVDATDPVVSFTDCPTTVGIGSSQSVTVSASDAHSGLAGAGDSVQNGASVALDTSALGPASKVVTAKDRVGREAQATCNYSVVYNSTGLFQPIAGSWKTGGTATNVLNRVKAGSSVPVKFSLDGFAGLQLATATPAPVGQLTVKSAPVTVSPGGVVDVLTADEASLVAIGNPGSSTLSYDAIADQYTYVWKTDKGWASSHRQLLVNLNEGTVFRANFHFVK